MILTSIKIQQLIHVNLVIQAVKLAQVETIINVCRVQLERKQIYIFYGLIKIMYLKRFLIAGSCIFSCPSHFYPDSTDNICKSCNSTCLSCDGANKNNCLTCDNP